MNKRSGCQIQILAKSEVGSVEYCPDCGIFHVNFGVTSFRMRLAALHRFNAMLTVALQHFNATKAAGHSNVLPFARPAKSQLH